MQKGFNIKRDTIKPAEKKSVFFFFWWCIFKRISNDNVSLFGLCYECIIMLTEKLCLIAASRLLAVALKRFVFAISHCIILSATNARKILTKTNWHISFYNGAISSCHIKSKLNFKISDNYCYIHRSLLMRSTRHQLLASIQCSGRWRWSRTSDSRFRSTR